MSKNEKKNQLIGLINELKKQATSFETQIDISAAQLDEMRLTIENLYQSFAVYNYLQLKVEPVLEIPIVKVVESVRVENVLSVAVEEFQQPIVETVPEVVNLVEELVETSSPKEEEAAPAKVEVEQIKEQVAVSEPKRHFPDIKTKIGINEKYQFLSDLFAGNASDYEAAMQQLNATVSLGEALQYVTDLQKKKLWSDESPAWKSLINVVERRFV